MVSKDENQAAGGGLNKRLTRVQEQDEEEDDGS